MRFRSLCFIAVMMFSLVIGTSVQAISVSPAIIDVGADAGKQVDFSILVTNEEAETLSFALTIQKFIPQGDGGGTQFLPQEDTSGLPDWLYLEAPTLTLRAGESRRMPVSLRVPNDATPGGHYAAIFLTQTSLDTAAGQNVSAIPRIGVLVFATVNGTMVERLALRNARTEQVNGSHLPVRFIADVENQGNIHVQPEVKIDITNMFGQTVATIDGNSVDARVLPGSKRIFASEWSKSDVKIGTGFWDELKQEWENGAIGWYEARVQVSSRAGSAGESRIGFQVWPWRSLSIGAGLLVLVGFVLWMIRRIFRR
ncbi:hypothetical protein IPH19_03340 [Candidatus Uhrbacteria bacterium]|nr:MAG: hypothetical protein IPH19_03340 [Candidatus Uhrbacteria bacterium]